MTAHPLPADNNGMNRLLLIAGSVVIFHLAALWALQTGLLRRAVQLVVPVQVLSEVITPPAPRPATPPPAAPAPPPKAPPPPAPPKPARTAKPQPAPAPQPLAVAEAAPTAPTVAPPAPVAPVVAAAPPATASTAPAGPASPPRLQLPSSAADYLNNPPPEYPRLSRRMGEQGKVVVRVLIGADGSAQKAEINRSSGYDRLDQAALATVLKWRYVPGKRGDKPEAMWFNVPINFVLE